jgi:dinuclear metal center YbgI/SA1388 family protein
MVQLLSEIVQYCNGRLAIDTFEDADGAHNGLQFQNSGKISKIVAAVDGSLETIEKTIAGRANLLLVHHGLFWGTTVPVTDHIYRKYKLLIDHDIAVYSCHLPLDAHLEIGNNALLAKKLQLTSISPEFEYHHNTIGVAGETSMQRPQLKALLASLFPRVTAMEFGPENLGKIGIVSGGSGPVIGQARELGISTVVIGECQQYHYNIARDDGINVYICGHYATETFGVEALGQEVARKFSLPFEFLATDCPL